MNGQLTTQNTRECGANGELVALRHWRNPANVADLTRVWNVDVRTPTWGPPTHAMQIFRYAEEGSIRLLWIIGRVVQWFRRRLPVEPNVERRRSVRRVARRSRDRSDVPRAFANPAGTRRPRESAGLVRIPAARPHRRRGYASISSWARARIIDGNSIPSALAVLRLITKSYLVDAWTGRLPGFSPLRMRST